MLTHRTIFFLLVLLPFGGCAGRSPGENLSSERVAARGTPSSPQTEEDGTATAPPEGDEPPPAMEPMLEAHNRARAEHCAPPLAWSEELEETAQGWADRLASRGCQLEHSSTQLGENLAMGTAGMMDASDVVQRWYREKEEFDFSSGGFSMETGHFTQLVWADTRAVGCATSTCQDMDIWVCNYDPPGNVRGQYQEKVLPSSCARSR